MPTSALIPRLQLLGDPARHNPKLSPDGQRLAFLAPVDGIMNLHAGPVGTEDFKPVTRETDRGIGMSGGPAADYHWAPDSQHLLYVQDNGGDENWRLYAVDVDTTDIRELVSLDGVHVRIVATSPLVPGAILVGINRRDPRWHDIHRLDLESGDLSLELENDGLSAVLADRGLRVRAGLRGRSDGGVDILWRNATDWKVLRSLDLSDSLGVELLGVADGDRWLFARLSAESATQRLVRIDTGTGRIEPLAGDPDYDVASAFLHPVTGEPQVAVINKERLRLVGLEAGVEQHLAVISEQLDGDFTITSCDATATRWLVTEIRDTAPLAYHLYDRRDRALRLRFHDRPWLVETALAPMEAFQFHARDGLLIRGYLTFPKGVARRNLKTVFWIHGGPWARDSWNCHPIVQLLANRGYLAVQVNYRGSTGFGTAFLNAGNKEWSRRMHDDVMDALEHLVAQGYTDPSAVGIAGASYGGYETLVALTCDPDAFACGVDICGEMNLVTLLRSLPPYWESVKAQFRERVGNPDTEEAFLLDCSPVSHVHRIKSPVLVIQTENDPRVRRSESDQIVAGMQAAGVPHEYLVIPNEGHGLSTAHARDVVYGAMERFLARHLGGRAED